MAGFVASFATMVVKLAVDLGQNRPNSLGSVGHVPLSCESCRANGNRVLSGVRMEPRHRIDK